MTLSDLNLTQPSPIQLSQVTNYVVINDPAFPPLSTIVVNGYDAYGNALSAVQVFPRTAKLVRYCDDVTYNVSQPNPIQLSQVTNYIPLYNDDATFPALSTTVVEGYNAYGNAIVHTQVFPRTVGLVTPVTTSLNVTAPDPIQLSQVSNYIQVDTGIDPLSCIVVNGYNAYGNAISAVQIFPRQVQLVKEVDNLNWNQTAADPIQLQQVTNYAQLYTNDVNFPALSTVVVNGYDAYGNALSAVQVFPRTASLVYKISPSTILDYSAPNPIQLSQVGNYVPLYNDDPNFPALSTVVVNGYDAFGNAISSVQVFPRMVSLVLDYNSNINAAAPLYFYPTNANNINWSSTQDYAPPVFGPLSLQSFSSVNVNSVFSLIISAITPPATNTTIENLSSYSNLHSLFLQNQNYSAVTYVMSQGLPDSIHTLDLYSCGVGNNFTQQYKSELHKVESLHFWSDNSLTFVNLSGLSALQILQCYSTPFTVLNVDDCDALNTIQISYCNSLPGLSLDHLSSIETCILYTCNSLSSFDVGAVDSLIDLEITNCPLSGELDLSSNSDLSYISITNTSLSSIIISPVKTTVSFDFNTNELTQTSIDDILITAAISAAAGSGSLLNVGGLNNSYPSSAGFTAIWTLTANNWAVFYNTEPAWSPDFKGSDIQLSNNNRTATQFNGLMQSVLGNKEIHGTDKLMYTIQIATSSTEVSGQFVGFGTLATNLSNDLGNNNQSIGVNGYGQMYFNGSLIQTGLPSFSATGDIIDVAINASTKWWYRVNNGIWNNNPSANPATNSGGLSLQSLTQLYPGVTPYGKTNDGSLTMLAQPVYPLPSGFSYYDKNITPPAPIVYLNADTYNGSSSTWVDSSGNANNATTYNNPTTGFGCDHFVSFASSGTQFADIPNIGNLSNWTVECWFKLNGPLTTKEATSVVTTVYDNGAGTNYGAINYCIATYIPSAPYTDQLAVSFFDGTWRQTAPFIPVVGQWVQVVGTYDGTVLKQYINGQLDSSLNYTGTSSANGGPIRIARRWDGPVNTIHYFPGDIGVTRIYNSALDASQINANYNEFKNSYTLCS